MANKTNLILTSRRTVAYISKRVKNFPNEEIILKDNIQQKLNQLLENIFYFFNNDKSNIKIKYLNDIIINLNILDFYINLSHDKELISTTRCLDIIKYLNDIKKITYVMLKYQRKLQVGGDDIIAI